jgi:hypothetical protein
LQRSVDAVRHYIQWHTMAVLEDRLSGRREWPPVQDSNNSAIAATSSMVPGEDGGYLNQRIQESLLAGNPAVPGADARQHAVYLAAQLVTHHCGPVAAVRAPPLSASQIEASHHQPGVVDPIERLCSITDVQRKVLIEVNIVLRDGLIVRVYPSVSNHHKARLTV